MGIPFVYELEIYENVSTQKMEIPLRPPTAPAVKM
jgi:hypothetical protein